MPLAPCLAALARTPLTDQTCLRLREMCVCLAAQIASDIRHVLDEYFEPIPAVLEIPSKDHPYVPEHDSIMQRVLLFTGEREETRL